MHAYFLRQNSSLLHAGSCLSESASLCLTAQHKHVYLKTAHSVLTWTEDCRITSLISFHVQTISTILHSDIFSVCFCHNEDGRIQLRKREFITRSNTQRELKVELFVDRGGAFRRAEAELSVGRNGAFRRAEAELSVGRNGAFRRAEAELSVGRNGAFRRQKRSFP